jgi:DNA-directed RNA polymerase specialized sigma24 family protein
VGVDPSARHHLDRQWRIVQEWLTGADARAAAAAELQGAAAVGLEIDDLLAETALRLWRTFRDRAEPVAEGDDGRGLLRYARRALGNTAIDAYRAAARRPEQPDADVGTDRGAGDGDVDHGDDPTWLPAARRVLHAELDEAPVAAAAALAAVVLLAEPVVLADDVPRPQRGATPAQAAGWAGLWFVDGDRLWVAPDDAAARQRRSRAGRQVDQRLRTAVTVALGSDHA